MIIVQVNYTKTTHLGEQIKVPTNSIRTFVTLIQKGDVPEESRYTRQQKYVCTPLLVIFNYLNGYLILVLGIFAKNIQFPVQGGVDHVATIIGRDIRAG